MAIFLAAYVLRICVNDRKVAEEKINALFAQANLMQSLVVFTTQTTLIKTKARFDLIIVAVSVVIELRLSCDNEGVLREIAFYFHAAGFIYVVVYRAVGSRLEKIMNNAIQLPETRRTLPFRFKCQQSGEASSN